MGQIEEGNIWDSGLGRHQIDSPQKPGPSKNIVSFFILHGAPQAGPFFGTADDGAQSPRPFLLPRWRLAWHPSWLRLCLIFTEAVPPEGLEALSGSKRWVSLLVLEIRLVMEFLLFLPGKHTRTGNMTRRPAPCPTAGRRLAGSTACARSECLPCRCSRPSFASSQLWVPHPSRLTFSLGDSDVMHSQARQNIGTAGLHWPGG